MPRIPWAPRVSASQLRITATTTAPTPSVAIAT